MEKEVKDSEELGDRGHLGGPMKMAAVDKYQMLIAGCNKTNSGYRQSRFKFGSALGHVTNPLTSHTFIFKGGTS